MSETSINRTLVVECASEACSVALFEQDRLIASEHVVLGRGHAERLVPMIAALPDKGQASRILTSLGPGSFTGVRIGIATARALGIAWGSTVLGYPTLGMVAASCAAESDNDPQPMTVCMNGGHGEWFIQNFGDDLLPQDTVRSVTKEDAVSLCQHRLIAGSRANDLAELLASDSVGGDVVACDLLPNAGAALWLPESQLSDDLKPVYGREPDAKLPSPKLPKGQLSQAKGTAG
ncbi:MAG: tRNA (adenosine(37)-N6)-threonylcarbamoyltransferase complex dimerization subunit type 1 TsaB [Erythrobacter sp.]